jgi:hypothetical protein
VIGKGCINAASLTSRHICSQTTSQPPPAFSEALLFAQSLTHLQALIIDFRYLQSLLCRIFVSNLSGIYAVASRYHTSASISNNKMAEILGTVASAIAVGQLAASIGGTLIRLKGYWDQVKDAPVEIQHLLQMLEAFQDILCSIRDSHTLHPASNQFLETSYVSKSFDLCQKGADELESLVSEMALKIEGMSGWKKKKGAVKIVLHKDEIKRLKKRMKNAVQMLQLALSWRTK